MPVCPQCHQTTRQNKDGRTAASSQRYRCKWCSCRYTPDAKISGYDEEIRLQAYTLYLEGVSLRGIARILAVNHQSVANWVNEFAQDVPEDLPDSLLETAVLDGLIFYNPRKPKHRITPQD
jgi:transposase-like protein